MTDPKGCTNIKGKFAGNVRFNFFQHWFLSELVIEYEQITMYI